MNKKLRCVRLKMDRGTDPMPLSASSPIPEEGSNQNESTATESSIRRLRNALNSSAQANNTNLERLQQCQRLLLERSSEQEEIGTTQIGTTLQNLREALNAAAENNSSCLIRLQKLRERLQRHMTLFDHSNNRNPRLQLLRNALNNEIEALNNMKMQFTNTSSRIERLRDEFTMYGNTPSRNHHVATDLSQMNLNEWRTITPYDGQSPSTSSSRVAIIRFEPPRARDEGLYSEPNVFPSTSSAGRNQEHDATRSNAENNESTNISPRIARRTMKRSFSSTNMTDEHSRKRKHPFIGNIFYVVLFSCQIHV